MTAAYAGRPQSAPRLPTSRLPSCRGHSATVCRCRFGGAASMTRYVAFLRGVNVGGVNLKMAEVAAAFGDAGFSSVRTILASGNVVLEAQSDAAAVRRTAETALRDRF